MNTNAKLTIRETEIAELAAWGATKKEISNHLYISYDTVVNHIRSIYSKIGCSKINELSAWWFCSKFNISFDLSPLKRSFSSFALIAIFITNISNFEQNIVRVFRTIRNSRKTELIINYT